MNRKRVSLLMVVSMLILSALACSTDTTPTQEPEPGGMMPETETSQAPTDEPTEAPDVTAPQDPLPEAEAGMACFGSHEMGITCLTEEGWQTHNKENNALADNYVIDMTTCPDGSLAVAQMSAISVFDGQTWKSIDGGWGYGSPEALACDQDGAFWVAHFEGVSQFKDGSWATFPSSDLATGEAANDLVGDVAVTPDGSVWVATTYSIAQYDNGQWNIFQEGQGFDDKYFIDQLAVDSQGQLWASHGGGLLAHKDGAWVSYDNPGYVSNQSMGIDAYDRVWVGTLSDGVLVFENGTWTSYTMDKGLSSNTVYAVAPDANGRVWLATSYGLDVFDGEAWQVYRMDNSDLNDTDLRAAITLAGGPALPEPLAKDPGKITGHATLPDGSPMANAAVEICVEILASSFSGDTPCSDQPYMQSTTTDADGNFTFDNVPVGWYILTMNTGDGWAQLTTSLGLISERIPVEPGETIDVGEIFIQEDDE